MRAIGNWESVEAGELLAMLGRKELEYEQYSGRYLVENETDV